jgi:Methylenetetrahydrofolate reductase
VHEVLKRKVDAGADRAITQFFFDNNAYFRFLDFAAAAGITIPIVPGTANFARRAGTTMPHWLAQWFDGLEDDPASCLVAARRLRRTGDRPHRPRRRGPALLHDKPHRSRLRDLSSDRAEAQTEGRGGGVRHAPGTGAAGQARLSIDNLQPVQAPEPVDCQEVVGRKGKHPINRRVGLQSGGLGAGFDVPQPDRVVIGA